MTTPAVTEPAADLPAPPAAAAQVFGAALPQVQAYAALLAGAGTERGLLGPREVPRLWDRHLLNCAGTAELIGEGQVVLDLGSGAGLPGLVIALLRPDVQVVLVESLQRRATFLSEAVEELGLRSVLVRRARAEELHDVLEVDVVTARAVAPLPRLAGWALPLLHTGGRLLAMKGEQAQAELDEAAAAVRALGGTDAAVVEVGDPALGTSARVVSVTRSASRPGSRAALRPPGARTPSRSPSRRRPTR